MQYVIHPADQRAFVDFGWLKARHSFNFGNHYHPKRTNFGALRVLNDDSIAPAAGFPMHGHKNMEIITLMQSGVLSHKDNIGNSGTISTDTLQIMSAGSGITHSEFNASSTQKATLLQIWILPNIKNVTPRYEQVKITPHIQENTFTNIVAPYNTETKSGIYQNAWLYLGVFSKKTKTTYTIKKQANGVYIFILEGSICIENQKLEQKDAIGIWDSQNISLEIQENSKVLLIEVPMKF